MFDYLLNSGLIKFRQKWLTATTVEGCARQHKAAPHPTFCLEASRAKLTIRIILVCFKGRKTDSRYLLFEFLISISRSNKSKF